MTDARPVFVLGTGRCGSTLVHEVLARHPDTGFITYLDDLGCTRSTAWQNEIWRRLPPDVTRKGGVRFAPSEAYRLLAREVSPSLVDPVHDLGPGDASPWLRARLEALVDDRVGRLCSPVFLHKFTGWPRAGLLRACFPDALFIEIVRDGRAVASSWLQMPWWQGHRGPGGWHFGPLAPELEHLWLEHDRSFAVLAALGWRHLMASYDSARAQVPPDQWLRLRYEDVVENPHDSFAEMLDRMGLEWTPTFAHRLNKYAFSRARTDAWRHVLSSDQQAAFDAVLEMPLAKLGYRDVGPQYGSMARRMRDTARAIDSA